MNILFISKVDIRMLSAWSYRSLPIMLIIEPRMVIMFEHVVQSLLNMCPCGICSWSHTKPHTTQIYVSDKKIIN